MIFNHLRYWTISTQGWQGQETKTKTKMAEIPKRLKMPSAALWRHELYHPISMKHRAHTIRAGQLSRSNFVCVCVCLCIKEFTDKGRKCNWWTGMLFRIFWWQKCEKCCKYWHWTIMQWREPAEKKQSLLLGEYFNRPWDCLSINTEASFKECLFLKIRAANCFPTVVGWYQN